MCAFSFVPWELAWGEVLAGELPGLDPETILNRGHWILPEAGGRARVGATYERAEGLDRRAPSPAARAELEQSVRLMGGGTLAVDGQEGGWRVTVPDRHPCVGRHPGVETLGLLAGLGSKGTLWAPELARLWVRFLQTQTAFPPELDVARFWPGG
jgi:glycine/D-amino acid oxidase-like deaminating enzyme